MIYIRDQDVALFEQAEQYAKRNRMSLSRLIAVALEQYLQISRRDL
jgi:hypothetical protein